VIPVTSARFAAAADISALPVSRDVRSVKRLRSGVPSAETVC
jgi:hypothetical protein